MTVGGLTKIQLEQLTCVAYGGDLYPLLRTHLLCANPERGVEGCPVSRFAEFPFIFPSCASTEGGTEGCHMLPKGVLVHWGGGGCI